MSSESRRLRYLRQAAPTVGQAWRGFQAQPAPEAGFLEVSCGSCPKYRRFPWPRCALRLGSRVRSCIVAAAERCLGARQGRMLEIGCGHCSIVRELWNAVPGNEWVGLEPRLTPGLPVIAQLVGRVEALPLQAGVFDAVSGIQTLEHWVEGTVADPTGAYRTLLAGLHRVLRPGGLLYLDAPIHQHGSRHCVTGDLAGIRDYFHPDLWSGLSCTIWRRQHRPLASRPARPHDQEEWVRSGLPADTIRDLSGRSVFLLSIVAQAVKDDPRPAPPPGTPLFDLLASPHSGDPLDRQGDRLVARHHPHQAYPIIDGVVHFC